VQKKQNYLEEVLNMRQDLLVEFIELKIMDDNSNKDFIRSIKLKDNENKEDCITVSMYGIDNV
jgi:hypothetical protein